MIYDRPSAGELLEAVAEFLLGDVCTTTSGRIQYHSRVSARVLEMIARELEHTPVDRARWNDVLESLGCSDPWELVRAIRSGQYDDQLPGLISTLRPVVRAKLAVSNPRYLSDPGAGSRSNSQSGREGAT